MIGDSIMCAGHSQVVIINGSKIQFFDNKYVPLINAGHNPINTAVILNRHHLTPLVCNC